MAGARCGDDVRSLLFEAARSQNRWLDRPVPDSMLRELYEVTKWGPTSMNSSPMRLLFLRTPEAKAKLLPTLSPGNIEKAATAPVVAVIAYDRAFHEHLPALFPHRPEARELFVKNEQLSDSTAFRNGTLQGAYLIIAARMLGLDCGPMSGFDEKRVNETFFHDSSLRVNFLCGLGYGDPAAIFPRHPRLDFDAACRLL